MSLEGAERLARLHVESFTPDDFMTGAERGAVTDDPDFVWELPPAARLLTRSTGEQPTPATHSRVCSTAGDIAGPARGRRTGIATPTAARATGPKPAETAAAETWPESHLCCQAVAPTTAAVAFAPAGPTP